MPPDAEPALRALFVAPHFVRPAEGSAHGSEAPGAGRARGRILAQVIASIRQHLGPSQWIARGRASEGVLIRPINRMTRARVDVVVAVTGEDHGLDAVDVPAEWYEVHRTREEPRLLPFACHDVLRERHGGYDWYVYLEDDLLISDPHFLHKAQRFVAAIGEDAVLVPNRYELYADRGVEKIYIDSPLQVRFTSAWQDVTDRRSVTLGHLGDTLLFERPTNPHAGLFVVSDAQLGHWIRQPWFGERTDAFVGPLESAASVALMRTFRIYKPAPYNANFFEVRHLNNRDWLPHGPLVDPVE